MADIPEDLTCPISLDLLNDPVALPCCGRAVSREMIILSMLTNTQCPLCRSEISNFSPATAAKLVNLAYMIEKFEEQFKADAAIGLHADDPNVLQGRLVVLRDQRDIYTNVIAQMEINTKSVDKILLLPVIDVSGSMDGSPLNQCKLALEGILDTVYNNANLFMEIITYDTSATRIPIHKSQAKPLSKNTINNIRSGGGTMFQCAFDKIVETLGYYNNNQQGNQYTNVIVMFLTDGQDGSAAQARPAMIAKFKSQILGNWHKAITVHTVGFSNGHDAEFLMNIKDSGRTPGAYRFADPGDDGDVLFNKISSLMADVQNAGSGVTIVEGDLSILSPYQNKYWVTMPKNLIPGVIQVEIDHKLYKVELETEDANQDIWSQWFSYMIDQMAAELLRMPSENNEIQLEVLNMKCKAIRARIVDRVDDLSRLQQLMDTIVSIRKKEKVDARKLTDLQYAGQYAVKTVPKAIASSSQAAPNVVAPVSSQNSYVDKIPKVNGGDLHNELTLRQIASQISKKKRKYASKLILAAFKGDHWDINDLVRHEDVNTLEDNMTPLDYAVWRGNWKTIDALLVHGARINTYKVTLTDNCTNRHIPFPTTASRIPILRYLQERAIENVDDTFNIYFHDGNLDALHLLPKLTKFSWESYMQILANPTSTQLTIIQEIAKTDWHDSYEIFQNKNDVDVWPVFIACEKGNVELLKILLPEKDEEKIRMCNSNGTTAFWIAACNNKINVMDYLISMGADPLTTNHKGVNALIPACQKGFPTAISYLLEVGCSPTQANHNGDTPIIICCRTGQVACLEMMLAHLNTLPATDMLQTLSYKAVIDGFDAVMAATELDKADCLPLLKQFGANLSSKTADDNPIIANAAAIHIAAMYGCRKALVKLDELGVDMNTTSNGSTLLHIAIQKSQHSIIEYLLQKYPEMVHVTDDRDKTPVHYASEDIKSTYFNVRLTSLIKSSIIAKSDLSAIFSQYGGYKLNYGLDSDLVNMLIDGMPILSHAIIYRDTQLMKTLLSSGASLKTADDHGISPAFWAKYMGLSLGNDEEGSASMSNIQARLKTPRQKMVLKLDGNAAVASSSSQENFLEMKMNNVGTGGSVSMDLVKKADDSMLGFLSQNKNDSFISAKVHVIKKIVSGAIDQDPEQALAIYLYLNNKTLFEGVTHALVNMGNWNKSKNLHSVISTLYKGLNTLPFVQKEVYCATDTTYNDDDFKIGSKITWKSFVVASEEWKCATKLIQEKRGVVYIVQSKTGRNVSELSEYSGDQEFVFLPGSQFNIVAHYVGTMATLGQKNIRQSACLPKPHDYQKAREGLSCLVVELEEIITAAL
jgi:ankyrin repeat protein/uncharacterized protein YegL